MSLKTEDWDSFLEAVSSNGIDQNYLQTSLMNQTDFITNIDNLGECALFYAITYQNKLLLSHLLNCTEYDSLTKKLKRKLMQSVFRGIKQLGYSSEANASFLHDSLQLIAGSPCQQLLKEFVHEGLFTHLFETVFQKEKKSFDLMNSILTLLKDQLLFTEDDNNFKNLQTLFQSTNSSSLWSHFSVRNFIKNPSFNLSYLEYEFFHYVAEKGLYNQMDAFNLTKRSEFLLKKNSSGENVLLILFKKAPFEFLNKHLSDFADALNNLENPLILANNRKQNFLHLLIHNKKANVEEKISLLQRLSESCKLEEFNKIADHNGMTPVVLFICKFSKEIQENLSSMIDTIQLLMPKLSQTQLDHSLELRKNQSCIFMSYLKSKCTRSLKLDGASHFIYNQKLIKICLDFKLESLLIKLMDKFGYLSLDSFYIENLSGARHFLCIAAENNLQNLLKWILEARLDSISTILQPLKEELEKNESRNFRENMNYSIFDQMLDFISSSDFDALESQTKNLFYEILEKLWNRQTDQEFIQQSLLNLSFTRQSDSEHYSVAKIINASKQVKIFNLFRNDILKLQNTINQDTKKEIFLNLLQTGFDTFCSSYSEFNFLIQTTNSFSQDEMKLISKALTKYSEFAQSIVNVCPEAALYLIKYSWNWSDVRPFQHLKKAVKNLSKFVVDFIMMKNIEEESCVSYFFGSKGHHENEQALFVEIIKLLVREKKVANFLYKLQQNPDPFKPSNYLDCCCLEYIKNSKLDEELEDQFITIYRESLERNIPAPIGWRHPLEGKVRTVIYQIENLEQLEKVGRMKLKGWPCSLVNAHSAFKKFCKNHADSPVLLYFLLFTSNGKSLMNEHAIQILQKSPQHLALLQSIYSYIFQNFHQGQTYFEPKLELLDHAILNFNFNAVEVIIDNKIYTDAEFQRARSPFYAVLDLLKKSEKDSEILKNLNRIVKKILNSFSKQIITAWLLPTLPGSKIPKLRKSCLLKEGNLHIHKFLDDENFKLIPWKSILTEAPEFFSFGIQNQSSVSFCIQAIYQRKAETIQTLLPLFLQIQPEEYLFYLKEEIDSCLLKHCFMLLNKEKFHIILNLVKDFKHHHQYIPVIVKSAFDFCFKTKDQTLLSSLVRQLVAETIGFKDDFTLNQLIQRDKLNYHLLLLSNACEPSPRFMTILLKDLIQVDFEEFKSIFDTMSQTPSRFGDLKYIFLERKVAEAVAANGLYKKLQFLFDLGQKLIRENRCTLQDITEWIQGGLEASCELNMIIDADKAVEKSKNSQFNYFDLGTMIMLNTKKIERGSSFTPAYSQFVRVESRLSKHYEAAGSHQVRKAPVLSEQNLNRKKILSKQPINNNIKKSSQSIYGSSSSSVKKRVPEKPQNPPEQKSKPQLGFTRTIKPLFQSYPKNWSIKNQKDESSLEKTIMFLLETLMMKLCNFQDLTDEITPIIQKNLILAAQSNISLAKNTLEKYLDELQTQDFEAFSQFNLQLLLTFFQTVNCFVKESKEKIHFTYKPHIDAIKPFLNRLASIYHKISEAHQQALENLVYQIYRYQDAELGRAFCEALVSNQQENSFLPKQTLKAIFLGLSIQQENLSCFMSLLKLDPSIKQIYRITEAQDAPGESFGKDFMLRKENILEILFSKNLVKFISEYDNSLSLLLQPIESPELQSRKSLIRKGVQYPKWIHLAILKGHLSLVEKYLSKMQFGETEVECALCSQNFDLLQVVIKKAFMDDSQRILEFLITKKVLLKLLQTASSESFILKVFNTFVFNTSLNGIQIKLLFKNETHLQETDQHGWTAFHYIAFRKFSTLFYSLLDFIKKTLCDNDQDVFIRTMTNLLNITTSYSFFALEDSKDFEPINLCPIQVSIASRFYELVCFAAEFNIPMENPSVQLRKNYSNFKYIFTKTNLQINEFSGLFVQLTKALVRILQLIQKLGSLQIRQLPTNWIPLLEDMFFALPLQSQESEQERERLPKQLSALKDTSVDLILIKLDPRIIPQLLNPSNWELSPLALTYILEKAQNFLEHEKTEYSKHLYQHYLQEIQKETVQQESKEENQFAKLWLDTELNQSLERITNILNLTERESTILFNPEYIGLTQDALLQIAAIYNSKNYKVALKTLILAFPTLFIQTPAEAFEREEETEKPSSFNFWRHFISYPNYMCSIFSALDDNIFNSLVASYFETLLSFYESAFTNSYSQHEIQSWAICIIYIIFSLRGENEVELLRTDTFPSLLKRVLTPLIENQQSHGHGQTRTFYLFFKNFSSFATLHRLTYKQMHSNEAILKEIGSNIIQSFLPLIMQKTPKGKKHAKVNLQDQNLDQFIGFAVASSLSKQDKDQNPLTFYSNFICTAVQILDLIQEVNDYAEKFNIAINLSIQPNATLKPTEMKKLASDKLQMSVCYLINYNPADKSSLLEWDSRQNFDIEQNIENLFIIDQIKQNFGTNLKYPSKEEGSTIEIDYDSIEAKANFQEKYNLLNNQLYLDFAQKTCFGILPYLEKLKEWRAFEDKSHLPVINETELAPAPLVLNQIVLSEFYQFFYPNIAHINVAYLDAPTFKTLKEESGSFTRLLRSLSLYEEAVLKFSQATNEQLRESTVDNVKWFIGGEPISSSFEIFYHDVYQVKQALTEFSNEIHKFGGFNLLPSSWKINTRSLLTAVSSLTETIRNAVSNSISSKEISGNSERKGLIQNYLNRKDDALQTTENYLRSSILSKIIYSILENLSSENLSISKSYNAIYVTLSEEGTEKPDPNTTHDWKNLHLFDQIIRFSGVTLQPHGKVLLVKVNYFVHKISFQDLEESSSSVRSGSTLTQSYKVQDYIQNLFSKFEVYRQLMTNNQFIEHILDKKLVDERLISMSTSISGKINKSINFTFDYRKLYELCASLLSKAHSPSTPKSESNAIFAKLEEKLTRIKEFISKKLFNKVEESILCDDYMDQLLIKVQIQNILYAQKKSYSEYLQEERLSFDIYPPKNPNQILVSDIPYHLTQAKFAFLIQTNKELTVPNAYIGQQYLIVRPSRITHHRVTPNHPLPYEGDAHYLLISPTWPDLDFCSNKYSRVLVIDGKNRIIDVSNSNLKDLIEDLRNDKKVPLVNKNFEVDVDSDITVHNLFSIYPSLFTFQLSSLDPENADLMVHSQLPSLRQGTSSHLFDEQKAITMSFINDQKLEISSLLLDQVQFSEKLNTYSMFQTTIYEFQREFDQMFETLQIKDLFQENQKFPKISILFDDNFRYNSSMRKFNEYFRLFIDNFKAALLGLLNPSILNLGHIQETACMLYDDIYLENNIISSRVLSSLCRAISNVEFIFKNTEAPYPIIFEKNTQTLKIFVQCLDEQEENFHFKYPISHSIHSEIAKLLIREEEQSLIQANQMLKKLSHNISLSLNLDHEEIEDQNIQQEALVTLLCLDILLWNVATALNLLHHNLPENFPLNVTTNREIDAKTTGYTLKITSGTLKNLIPTHQEIYQKLNTNHFDTLINLKAKPLSHLTLYKQAELSFTLDRKELVHHHSDLSQIQIDANFLGIKTFDFLTLKSLQVSQSEEEVVVKFLIPVELFPQNYLVYLSINNRLLLKSFLVNILDPTVPQTQEEALSFYQKTVVGQTEDVKALIKSSFYLIAKSKKNIPDDKNKNTFAHHLTIQNQDSNDPRSFSRFNSNFIKISSKSLDETNILYKIIVLESFKLKFTLSSTFYTFFEAKNSILASFWAEARVSFENTQVRAPTGQVYTSHKKNDVKEFEMSYGEDYKQLYLNLDSVSAAPSVSLEDLRRYQNIITEKDLENSEIKKFMDANFIQNIGKNDFYSKTGEERKESMQFRDKNGQEILIHFEEVLTYSALFIHNRNHEIVFEGKISHQDQNFFVTWTPLIKGSYSLLINSKFVQSANNLIVIASESSSTTSTFRWPRLEFYAFYDPFSFEVELKDRFGNRLNQVEVDKYYKDNKTVQMQISQPKVKPKITFEKVNNLGVQLNNVSLSPDDLEDVFTDAEITLTFLLDSVTIHKMLLKILGVGFRKRLDLFSNDIAEFRKDYSYTSLNVSRLSFFKSLSEFKLDKFKSVNHIVFINEPGADAGGLRREFWELVGKEIKNSTYKVFAGTDDRYYFSYDYTLNEKTENSIKLYGALIASSILHKQLIGVNFASGFSKALLGGQLDLEDLKEVFGEQVYNNYKMLNTMSDEDLDDLEQHFTVNIKDKQYQLLPDGENMKVTKDNLKLFFERLVHFYFFDYHKKAIVLIKEGFNVIFPLQRLTKWFVSSDLSLLTFGTLNVTGTNVLKFTKFGGSESTTLQQFFSQFLLESDPELLRNFLKFVTGSSALPYDDPYYSLLVTFESHGSNKLPISHTCSKHIEVPKYRNYEQMKKMLTIAFIHASEGFGFA